MDSDKMDKSIYRFMSFESFVDLIQRKALAFVHHEKWKDPYEGFLFKAIKDKDGRAQILNILKKITPENAIPNFGILDKFGKTIFGQSWTKCPENNALWSIYSHYNTSVRVEVKLENISKLNSVTLHYVQYSDSISLESQLKEIFKKNKAYLHKIFLIKRTAFEYEDEVRLLTHIDLNYLEQKRKPSEIRMMAAGLNALFKDGQLSKKEVKTGLKNFIGPENLFEVKHISFNHIDDFIRSVMLHPQAPDWFNDTLKMLCKEKKLTYHGKSKLYEFFHNGPQSST